MDRYRISAAVLVITSILLIVAVARGVRARATPAQIFDETTLGIIAILTCVAVLVPQLRIATGTMSGLLFIRFLWTAFRRIRDSQHRSQSK